VLVRPSLRWMVPVALVAAVLLPAAAAQAPDLGRLVSAPSAPHAGLPASVAPPAGVPDAQALQEMLRELRAWQARHTPTLQPEPQSAPPAAPAPPSGPQGQQAPALDPVRDAANNARSQAKAQAQAAQDQAGQQAQSAQDQAGRVVGQVPKDPVGLATGTARQATQSLPPLFTDPAVAPQAAGGQVVAPDPGLMPPILAGSLLVAGAAGATFFAFWLAGSSGTVASGAAAARTTELRKLLPFASPLFTRFEKETVLGHPRREALYALILQQPGVSLQALGEATGLSRTAVLHHLRLLEMQHLVVSKRMGRSRHYYENGGRYGRDAKEAYAILQNARSKEVAEFIRTHPGAMQKQLCEALSIQPSIAHWHVRRLQQAQLVDAVRQGRAVNYFPGAGLLEVAAQPPIPALPEMPPQPAPLAASTPLGA
jgi:DNA-binding transcriptional ArsR family regulator